MGALQIISMALCVTASSANLISNGSFETGVTIAPLAFVRLSNGSTSIDGWEVTLGNIDYVESGWISADGARSIDLDGNLAGAIAQDFATTPGSTYLVEFDMAGNSANAPVVKPMLVSAAGSATFYFDTTGASPAAMGWQEMSWKFIADSTTTTLEFRSLNEAAPGWGAAIDDVRVVECSNIVTNGSFESGDAPGSFIRVEIGEPSIDGWGVTVGNVDYVGTGWVSAEGSRSIDLDGDLAGAITQEIPTKSGKTYSVAFAMAGNSAFDPVVKSMQVSAAGEDETFFFDTSGTSPANMGWQQMFWEFVAASDTTTLEFRSLNATEGFGPALDDVRVMECLPLEIAPTPGLSVWGLSLLAGLLIGTTWWLRRRLLV
jgi:choice-of-anchor C domain-containing protein